MDAKEDASPKMYFWAYDIFGYLLPGALLLGLMTFSNDWLRTRILPYWSSGHPQDLIAVAISAYIVGHGVSGLSSFVLEKGILSRFLKYPTARLFADPNAPRSWSAVPSYGRPYSASFQAKFRREFTEAFGLRLRSFGHVQGQVDDASEGRLPDADEHDCFWLVWSYNSLHHPAAFRRGTHFLDLYGYSRNMATVLVLVAASVFLPNARPEIPKLLWLIGGLVLAFLSFANYAKLMRRLNDETYRGFVAVRTAHSKH